MRVGIRRGFTARCVDSLQTIEAIRSKEAGQTYRPDSVDRLTSAGNHSSGRSIATAL